MTQRDSSLTTSTVVRGVGGHWCADAAAEKVILHAQSGEYFGLNGVGSRVWTLLGEPRSIRELTLELARHFDVPAGQVAEDLVPFLNELIEVGLAEVVSA